MNRIEKQEKWIIRNRQKDKKKEFRKTEVWSLKTKKVSDVSSTRYIFTIFVGCIYYNILNENWNLLAIYLEIIT